MGILPAVAMEVMVSGRPLIATDCIGMNEVVADSPTLVFSVGSVDGLLEQLERFESAQSEVKAEFEKYRKMAAERFDVSITASKLKQVFERVLESRGAAG